MKTRSRLVFVTLGAALFIGACGGTPRKFTTPDFERLQPKTVLVLPPENTTSNTEVLEKAYPFIFSKLAQRGYYVVSPELAMQLFVANKLNEPGRLNTLPSQKFADVFGVDAVLKTRVIEWSSKYVVLSSTVNVGFEMNLIDCRSGKLLWSHKNTLSRSPDSGGGGGNPIASLIGALVKAAVHAAATPYEPIASENAAIMMSTIPIGAVNVKKE
jgi:hypothetical protein